MSSDLSYSIGGLHVAAFAAGSVVAGLSSGRLEARVGRRAVFWAGAGVMGAATVALRSAARRWRRSARC